MKFYILTILTSFCFLTSSGQSVQDELIADFCLELEKSGATKHTVNDRLPEIERTVFFSDQKTLVKIAHEADQKEVTLRAYFSEFFIKFSQSCPAYQALYSSSEIKLKNKDFFTEKYCDCFKEQSEGDMTERNFKMLMESCNDIVLNDKEYKKKVREELKNKDLSGNAFSQKVSGDFLTQCDLIAVYFFNERINSLAKTTELKYRQNQSEFINQVLEWVKNGSQDSLKAAFGNDQNLFNAHQEHFKNARKAFELNPEYSVMGSSPYSFFDTANNLIFQIRAGVASNPDGTFTLSSFSFINGDAVENKSELEMIKESLPPAPSKEK
ncbi:MAG: hypothetical protein ACK4ND_07080 [Cytophagaceae bacterium]